MSMLEHIPDTIKAGVAVAAPGLTLFGVAVEEWTFVLSGIVSILFILEKLPGTIKRSMEIYRKLRDALRKK